MANNLNTIGQWLDRNATCWRDIPLVIVGTGQWSISSIVVERRIPGSDDTITQVLGLGEWTVQHSLLFKSNDDLAAFQLLQGQTGSLVVKPNTAAITNRRSLVIAGKIYDVIDNVMLKSVSNATFKRDAGRCSAVFVRKPT